MPRRKKINPDKDEGRLLSTNAERHLRDRKMSFEELKESHKFIRAFRRISEAVGSG